MKIPATCPELMTIATLPYSQAAGLISQADPSLVSSCFSSRYPNWGHPFMHASDHKAALVILLGREPSFLEVQDSAHLTGSKNIDAARVKSGAGADSRPSGWDDWTNDQRRYHVLVHIHGMNRGGKIFDGKIKQTVAEKAKTEALIVLWGLKEPSEPVTPPIDPAPVEPIPVSPAIEISGEITIKVFGVDRMFILVEKKELDK